MLKIAVCDDDIIIAYGVKKLIKEINNDNEVYIFESGKDFLSSSYKWDIVFLDIEMDGLNGFETAERFLKKQPECVFSFVTTHIELAVDGYDYQPFRYILKNAPPPVLRRKIRETIDEFIRRNKTIKVSFKGVIKTININDILYIEIVGHNLQINTIGDTIVCGKTINEIEKELKNYGFVRCHRSYIVPLREIEEFKTKELKLKNGERIPIGRLYKTNIENEYKNFKFYR